MEIELKPEDKSTAEVMDGTKKRGSLSRIFRMKSSKSSLDGSVKVVDDSMKRSTLSRLLNLRKSDDTKDEIQPNDSKQRLSESGNSTTSSSKKGSLMMRSLVVPWLSRRSSTVNIIAQHNDLTDIPIQTDLETPQEVISTTTNF